MSVNEKALEYAEATLRLEGKIITEKQKALVISSLQGEIDEDEFIRKALELASKS